MKTQPRLMTTADVMRELAVCKSTVRNLVHRGDLPAFKIGKSLRFERQDVQAYIDEQYDAHRVTPRTAA